MNGRPFAVLLSALLLLGGVVQAQAAPTPGDPVGRLDTVDRRGGSARLGGWAWDPDTAAPAAVHVYVDGAFAARATADAPRPDVAVAFPAAGTGRGWTVTVPVTRADSTICAYALNTGPGTQNTTLGCARAVLADRGATFGSFDEVRVRPDGLVLRGWAIDPDTFTGARVGVTFPDGTRYTEPTQPTQYYIQRAYADKLREDVGRAFPAEGDHRGFEYTILGYDVDGERVCVAATDGDFFGPTTRPLGCRTISRPVNPFGFLDGAVRDTASPGASRVVVRGWALDYDTAESIVVHLVTLDTASSVVAVADVRRDDVARAYPGYASTPHGFESAIDVPAGETVCAYAINVGKGDQNTTLGCATP